MFLVHMWPFTYKDHVCTGDEFMTPRKTVRISGRRTLYTRNSVEIVSHKWKQNHNIDSFETLVLNNDTLYISIRVVAYLHGGLCFRIGFVLDVCATKLCACKKQRAATVILYGTAGFAWNISFILLEL